MSFPHLDDDALSAAIDGVGTDDAGRHLAGCDRCRTRLDALRAVARAVAAPVVPAPAAAVDAAIRMALDAAGEAGLGPARPAAAGGGVGVGVRPADGTGTPGGAGVGMPSPPDHELGSSPAGPAAAGVGGRSVPTRGRPSGGHGGRAPGRHWAQRDPARARVLAGAAIVVAVLGLAGLVAALGRSGSPAEKAASSARPAASSARTAGPGGAPSTTIPGSAQAEGPAAVAPPPAGQSATAGGGGSRPAAAGAFGGGPVVEGADLGQQTDPATLTQQLTAIVGTVLQPAGGGAPPAAGAAPPAAPPCAAQGVAFARLTGQAAVLRYVATLRYQGAEAVALIYARSGGWTAVVLRNADCGGLLVLPSV